MAAFYAARNYAPLWTADGRLDARAKSVIAQLANAAADGLDPADYPVPAFGAATSAEALADADITLTYSALTYARHLATGRIAPGRVVTEVDYGDHTPAPADILRKIAERRRCRRRARKLQSAASRLPALKAKLAELRARAMADLSASPTRRLPAAKSVHAKIRRHYLPQPARKIDRVVANMERWRWLPRDLGKTYVMVNIPDYSLKVVHDRHEQWRTKIVAGKPQTPTPLLTASMDTVLVNPSWHVPQSIIKHEFLPRYGRDPNIFARMGLEVKRSHDGTLNVTQPPGAGNALGRIKFNFPNKFSVYLHDTPQKQLFAADKRAFSHGCMRVENPTKFGEIMLHLAMAGPTPNAQQLSDMFGRERARLQAHRPADGAPHLPDRLRRRFRQAAAARGHLRLRRAHPDHPAQRRASDRRHGPAGGRQARAGQRRGQPGHPAPGRARARRRTRPSSSTTCPAEPLRAASLGAPRRRIRPAAGGRRPRSSVPKLQQSPLPRPFLAIFGR